jgi:hypothetical protein
MSAPTAAPELRCHDRDIFPLSGDRRRDCTTIQEQKKGLQKPHPTKKYHKFAVMLQVVSSFLKTLTPATTK